MQKINFLLFTFCLLFSDFCYAQSPENKREKMIIVAHISFVQQLPQYVEAKANDNIDCLLITTDSTDNSHSIKAKIDNSYEKFPADFLLLVGDNEHIPAYKIEEGLSDVHYTFENEDNPIPRMSVGRFSAETAQDLQTMIDRTLIRNPFSKHVLGIASRKESDLTQKKDYEQVRFMGQQFQSKGFTTVSELFDGSPNGNPNYRDVISALQSGVSWINYAGYGSYEGWNTTEFENQHIDSLPDNVELPIIISASCLGGHFANRTCFAEKWLRSTKNGNPIGAIAVMMSSSLTDWDATLSAMLVISENMPATDSNIRLGHLYLQGYRYILDTMQRPKDAQCWILFGDPSLWIYPRVENNNVKKTSYNQAFMVYPNPTSSQLRIKNYELREDAEYTIYSVVGQVVQQGKLHNNTIKVESLASGMYFLKIDGKVVRFVKE